LTSSEDLRKVGLKGQDIQRIKAYLANAVGRELEVNPITGGDYEKEAQQLITQVYTKTGLKLPETLRKQVFRDVYDNIWGYGPITVLLNDSEITEVMVNGPNQIYVERMGKLIKTNIKFENDNEVIRLIERIVTPLGRRIDSDRPTVDARLPDGSRVNAVIPPVAIDGPSITIRKFGKEKFTIEQLIGYGSLTPQMAEFLHACVVARLNILISGGTGSGKTTLLNVLSRFIPSDERIVTIEDSAELKLHQDHIVRLETRPPGVDGTGGMTIRELVRNTLRMRPDRIVVGEVRGGEALDMLQAMNTGHDGSLTTLHANSPRDGLSRLEMMSLMAGIDFPLRVVREQIASAVDLIIQQSRLRDGTRKVTQITEVVGMEGDTIVMTDIFKFDETGTDSTGKVLGELKPTGIRPLFSPRLEVAGFKLKPEVFGVNIAEMLASNRRSASRGK
jgi:pilus assembly protein CpaF